MLLVDVVWALAKVIVNICNNLQYTYFMKLMATKRGFALPTVMIASVVMLIVLLSSLTSTSSVSSSIRSQFYNKLAEDAAEAGLAMAKSCLDKNGIPGWSTASPLRPSTACTGGAGCSSGNACFVSNASNVRTTFSVGSPQAQSDGSYIVPANGETQLVRTTDGTVSTQKYTSTATLRAHPVYWRSIKAGTRFTCGTTLSEVPAYDNKLKCWGRNSAYYLGNGTAIDSSVPVSVSTGAMAGLTVKKFGGSSLTNSCVVASNDQAYCWGHNQQGQLGDNTTSVRSTPVALYNTGVLAGLTINETAPGANASCVIASNSRPYCWGQNTDGQLGNNSLVDTSAPVAVTVSGVLSGKTLTKIAAGNRTFCTIATDARIYCWGTGYLGQLGNGTTPAYGTPSVPTAVTWTGVLAGLNATDIALGNSFTCMLASNSRPYCWGSEGDGRLGNGSISGQESLPVAVTATGALSGKTLIDITAGNAWGCVVATDGRAYCWGKMGEFSGTEVINSSTPLAVSNAGVLSGKTLVSISAGYEHTCALDTQGKSYCWGGNSSGEFGNGTTTGSANPVATFNTWRYTQF